MADTENKNDDKQQIVLCPYCGHVQKGGEKCEDCNGLFEPFSRRATQIGMGPWFIRDKKNPFRPGCSFAVIKKMVNSGKLKSTTVLRGPTTRQFWSVARNVPGIAHLLGYCHACTAKIDSNLTKCSACNAEFPSPDDRNAMGLLYPTENDADAAQQALNREMEAMFNDGGGDKQKEAAPPSPGMGKPATAMTTPTGQDLLTQVLGPLPGQPEEPFIDSGVQVIGSPTAMASAPPPSAPAAPATPQAPPQPAAPSSPQPPVPAAGTPQTTAADRITMMDFFTPSEMSDGRDEPVVGEIEKRNKRLSAFTWLLVAVNVLVLLGVVIAFWLMSQKGDDNGNDPKPIDGGTTVVASIVGHWVAIDNDGTEGEHFYFGPSALVQVLPGAEGTDQMTTLKYSVVTRESDTVRIQLPDRDGEIWTFVVDSDNKGAKVSRENAAGRPIGSEWTLNYLDDKEEPPKSASTGDEEDDPPVVKEPAVVKWDDKIRQAEGLEHSLKYSEALALLDRINGEAPDRRRAHRLKIARSRLKEKIDRQQVIHFFGVPAD